MIVITYFVGLHKILYSNEVLSLFEVSESVSSQRQFVDNAVGKYYVDSLILADNLDMEYNQVTDLVLHTDTSIYRVHTLPGKSGKVVEFGTSFWNFLNIY